MTLEEQLYRALLISPCRCECKLGAVGYVVVGTCSRCLAIARYEAENPAPEIAPGVTDDELFSDDDE
jgi:hypothetical protein